MFACPFCSSSLVTALKASDPNSENITGLPYSFFTLSKRSPKEIPRYTFTPKISTSGQSFAIISKNNKSPLQIATGCDLSIDFIATTPSLNNLYMY